MKRFDPLLRLQPWKVFSVFSPIERVLHRLEADGTVESSGQQIVFKEDGKGGYYDLVAALRGVIEFHELAATRHSLPIDLVDLHKFASKLDSGSPIFEDDITDVRGCIASCKSQAMKLRVSQATEIINIVSIRGEIDRLKLRKTA